MALYTNKGEAPDKRLRQQRTDIKFNIHEIRRLSSIAGILVSYKERANHKTVFNRAEYLPVGKRQEAEGATQDK
jgi:hypothetical protein